MNRRTWSSVGTLLALGLCFDSSAAPLTKTVGALPPPLARKVAAPLLQRGAEKTFAVKSGKFTVSTGKGFARAAKRTIVIVGCTAVNESVLKKFALKNSQITGVYPDSNVVTVALGSDEDLQAIAAIPEVVRIRPAYKGRSNVGVAESQGVKAHRVDTLRSSRFLDGASQKVGILSDSFAFGPPVRRPDTEPPQNTPGTLRNSKPQLMGELPAEVELLADDANVFWPSWTPGDEGEAMAELIYDIAPGAKLAFHTAEPDFLRMAQGILALRSAGCTIITDDYTYYDEPWFMESPVSTAIASVIRSGTAYFTCAGNSSDSGIRLSYQDANPGVTDNESWPATEADLAVWGSGYGPYLPITFTPDSEITLVLQWNQPWETFSPSTGGAQVDLDLYFMTEPVPPSEASLWFSYSDSQGEAGSPMGDPIETLYISYSGTEPITAYVAVDHFHGPQNHIPQNRRTPVEFWLWAYRADEHGVIVPVLGPTTTGHQTASGAGCVAAVRFEEAPAYDPVGHGPTSLIDPEWFTSRGGNIQIPFNAQGRYKPRVALVPNIAAVDGCDTLLFGFDYDDGTPFPNFFGTSAAAPNAAAVAALLRQADSKLKPADIMRILSQTAVDVTGDRAAAGFDQVTGAGLVDAWAAIGKIRKGENLAIVPGPAPPDSFPNFAAKNIDSGAAARLLPPSNLYRPLRLSNRTDWVPFPDVLLSGQPVYAWFSVANTGTSEAGKASQADILVDGVVVKSFAVPPLYGPSVYSFSGVELPPFGEGEHEVEVRVDATNRIRELNEADNSYRLKVIVFPSDV
ncbi:MAG: CARDB domain-containing protein [Candidatus Sumerlaeaceae bacterium]